MHERVRTWPHVESQIKQWLEVDGYVLTVEPHPEPPEFAVKAQVLRDISRDSDMLVLIGDILQNARSALDHMAFALGNAGASGGWMDEKTATATMFPVIGDVDSDGFFGRGPDNFAAAAKRQLATVAGPARAVIERLQPYYVGESVWRSEPLWILHELARYDRHRFFHLTAVKTGHLEPDPALNRNVKIEALCTESGGFFPEWDEEDGVEIPTVIARVTVHPADPKRDMSIHFRGALQIEFDADGLPESIERATEGTPIDLVLRRLVSDVRRTLSELVPFLPGDPQW